MNIFLVVSQPQDWPFDLPGVTVIPAQTYLMDSACGEGDATQVLNLCRSYRYQGDGYYVSLLAQARGHTPLPDVQAIKELSSNDILQEVAAQLGDLIDCTFACTTESVVDLTLFFGRDTQGRYPHLSMQLFTLLKAPLMHVRLERMRERWQLCSVHAGSPRDIPEHQRALAAHAALAYLHAQKVRLRRPPQPVPSVAILHDPLRRHAPSNAAALRKFVEAGELLGMRVELITPHEVGRLHEFDALFIRDTTNVDHPTYRCAREAAADGMVVIDDPDSILRCTNKIYLAELLQRHHVPVPKTLVVHQGNIDSIAPALGLPCILKQPDGAFSLGVVRVATEQALIEHASALLQASELVLAQQYLPTAFDWRVGVLDGRALFVCRYHMAPGHWQVLKHAAPLPEGLPQTVEGRVETLCIGEVPDELVRTAVQAANLMGDGFYGVDLKQVGGHFAVIEINDNPNVDAGNEDAVLGEALYREVMGVFRKRIEARKGNTLS